MNVLFRWSQAPRPPLAFLLIILVSLSSCASEESDTDAEAPVMERMNLSSIEERSTTSDGDREVTIAFYNVENLFDTEDDPATDDEEFTPRGSLKWTEERLEKKMEGLARAVRGIDSMSGPDIIGFAEVENRSVLERFAGDFFPGNPWRIVHEDSPDGRGIDVALLYRPEVGRVRRHTLHPVNLGRGNRPTRSILNVEFVRDGIPFNVLVNHWPSRSGGERESRWKRGRAAAVLRGIVDSIVEVDPGRDLVIIGDFNDTPLDPSIAGELEAGRLRRGHAAPGDLFDLGWEIARVDTFGTYLYREDWDLLDQIIVNGSLFDDHGLGLLDRSLTIFAPPYLRDDHPSQPMRPPRRTYIRRTLYIGGTSDHFPVYARFRWQ